MNKILIIIASMFLFMPYLVGGTSTIYKVKRCSDGITVKMNGQTRDVSYTTSIPEGAEITIPKYGQIELYSVSDGEIIEYNAVFGPRTLIVKQTSLSASGTRWNRGRDNRSIGTGSRGSIGKWAQNICLGGWDQKKQVDSCMRYYYKCMRKNYLDTAKQLLDYCGIEQNE